MFAPITQLFSFLEINKKSEYYNKKFDDLIFRLIKESKEKLNDLKNLKNLTMLDLMIKASNESEKENSLSDQEIRDNVSIFFLAGYFLLNFKYLDMKPLQMH
jgi:cytochrome P450